MKAIKACFSCEILFSKHTPHAKKTQRKRLQASGKDEFAKCDFNLPVKKLSMLNPR